MEGARPPRSAALMCVVEPDLVLVERAQQPAVRQPQARVALPFSGPAGVAAWAPRIRLELVVVTPVHLRLVQVVTAGEVPEMPDLDAHPMQNRLDRAHARRRPPYPDHSLLDGRPDRASRSGLGGSGTDREWHRIGSCCRLDARRRHARTPTGRANLTDRARPREGHPPAATVGAMSV